MDKQKLQDAWINGVCMDLEIDPTDGRESNGQTFFLFTKREASRVVSRCYALNDWSPVLIPFDLALPPAGKGMQWVATDFPGHA